MVNTIASIVVIAAITNDIALYQCWQETCHRVLLKTQIVVAGYVDPTYAQSKKIPQLDPIDERFYSSAHSAIEINCKQVL